MTEPPVLADRRDHILTLTLNRPQRLNAVNEDLYRQLDILLCGGAEDPTVRVIVLRGAGRAFCAGADLKAHAGAGRTLAERQAYADLAADVIRTITTIGTPVVAAVHGYAIGAGAELAVSADFLIAADDAVLSFPELSLGTYVGGGVTVQLPRLVGLARARELLLLGRRLTGAEAADWHLAHRAVPPGELDEAVAHLADRLATAAPVPTGLMKTQLRDLHSLDEALRAEVAALVHCMGTTDWAEGVAAYADRRTPVFEGR
jgi:enoyl-CoA hydratase/carnithine racemase